jgi:hypothetical protein
LELLAASAGVERAISDKPTSRGPRGRIRLVPTISHSSNRLALTKKSVTSTNR